MQANLYNLAGVNMGPQYLTVSKFSLTLTVNWSNYKTHFVSNKKIALVRVDI